MGLYLLFGPLGIYGGGGSIGQERFREGTRTLTTVKICVVTSSPNTDLSLLSALHYWK